MQKVFRSFQGCAFTDAASFSSPGIRLCPVGTLFMLLLMMFASMEHHPNVSSDTRSQNLE
jgi:hypothetical protein